MGVGVGNYEWWEYFIIPWVAAFVGFGTNVLALQMTFLPLDFWGIPLFRLEGRPWGIIGWQGIIPTKAEKMAGITFDMMTTRLFNIKEIFNRLDAHTFAQEMEDGLLLLMDKVMNEVANEYMPGAWNKLPQDVRDEIIVMTESDEFIEQFMVDLQNHIEDVVDIRSMTIQACVANKPLVNKIFLECGEKEFTFIRRSGFYFGFIFGCIQMGIWFVYDSAWVLPVAGFLVGWFTNWIALKLIFSPLHPKRFLCWTIHGLFLKRQHEVSETFARIICVEILHTKAIWDSIFDGPLSNNFIAMLRAHTLVFVESMLAEVKPIAVAAMGAVKYAQMKEDIAQKVIDELPGIIDQTYAYSQEALDMETTIRTKMQELPSEEFEGVLHPAFQEDEITLIFLGGVLGAIVGVIQLFVLFYE
mmetsp:Transcript_14980/g.27063  ORF Transcript_14980/g.27063 Transcript_14980/m.27063 type:complete len:414 (-) Transcript_14980:57-1298(-)|eukprot:CAMPEP_0202481312 /NCGR_PEP_ID=MMETSP1361-20130828/938_1 /ASSEMBLY_ACC=CAM_ASM_000849 /TAXON_ID=210615 /ORGANISM="Staurosira complex sp., Strain CCMP2646" /LENGTH=413 /DNA_ID=CAMNT_0049108815 /DNA_START=114 /DNA_END=1355 /DNA_ORIENTATION=-